MQLLLRSSLRRRWLSTVTLVVLLGVVFGVTLASAVGARRTATAFPRLSDETGLPDLVMYVGGTGEEAAAAIVQQPQVELAGVGTGVGLMPRLPDGSPDFENALGAIVTDQVFGSQLDQPLLLEGRLPRADAPSEILIDENAAKILGLGIGDTFPGLTFDVAVIQQVAAEFEESGREPTEEDFARVFTPVDLDIIGVGRTSDAILVNEAVTGEPAALLSAAYLDDHPEMASYTVGVVDLAAGAEAGEYVDAVRAAAPALEVGPTDQEGRQTSFAAAIRPYWLALAFFSVVLGVGAVFGLGPALVRVVDEDLAEHRTLRALGARRSQLAVVALARVIMIGVGGALVGAVVAVAVSGRFPVGPARAAEPDPGTELHLAGVAVGTLLLLVALAAAAVGRVALLTRTAPVRRRRPSAIVASAGSIGLPPTALTGLHAAFAAGPARSRSRLGILGIASALTMAIAALGFGAGLTRLVDEPERFGWNWDVLFENYDTPFDDELTASIRADDAVSGVVPISRGSVTLGGEPVPAIGVELETVGSVSPTVLQGRAPAAAGEVGLGAVTAEELGVGVGDSVSGSLPGGGTIDLAVTAIVVVPSIQLDETVQLGQGAIVAADDFDRLAGWFPTAALADVEPGTTLAELEERHPTSALGVQRPGDITSYDGVDDVPAVLAGMLGALGVAVLVHLLIGSVRQRQRELGVLRAVGLRPRQVAGTVLWQTSAQVGAVLVVSVPLGILAGRGVWGWFAEGIGVASDPSTPLAVVAVAVAALVLITVVVALLPARRAASVHPARVLRSE